MYKRCPRHRCGYRAAQADEMNCRICGEKLIIQLERGDKLGEYVIRQGLASGEGGMGMVYRVRHQTERHQVAIKIAHGKDYQYDALELEAESLAKLDHPGIVHIRPLANDVFIHKTYLMGEPLNYIVLDWIVGRSFKDLLAEQGIPSLPDVSRIIDSVAQTLAHAHAQGVLHLDVKPANIMIDAKTGRPVLMDFGISRLLANPERQIPEKNLGTAGYMSPEHIRRQALDERSDVFSLGVVLYELLTGIQGGPFRSRGPQGGLQATLTQEVVPPSTVNGALNRRWDRLMAKALAKSRDQRFASMAEFRHALQKASRSTLSIFQTMAIAVGVVILILACYAAYTRFWTISDVEPTPIATDVVPQKQKTPESVIIKVVTPQPDIATPTSQRQPTQTLMPIVTSTP